MDQLAKNLFDTGEAAEYLNVKIDTLEAWRCRGCGPRYLKMGRLVRYRKVDLDAFVESGLRECTKEKVLLFPLR